MIPNRNQVIRLNRLIEFLVLHLCSQSQKVSPVFFQLFASKSPSRFSVLFLYHGYLRILRMTSPLLIFLVSRLGSHWVLASIPYIMRIWPRPSQWEWGNVEVTYKLLEDLGYSHSSLLTETRPISVSPPL